MAENIQVAVRVRPLSSSENGRGCTQSIRQIGTDPQVIVNNVNSFTFNHIFMPDSRQESVYDNTVANLVDKLFDGFNCTVLAYGQTGSGKTYTMGTNYAGALDDSSGIIPRAIIDIFNRLDQNVDLSAEIKCSFMELYQEELFDLLATNKKALDIREQNKIIEVPGLTEIRVHSPEDTSDCLVQGSARRATGSTAMNETSSRSHAIFTINVKVTKGPDESSAVSSKFHLVDLAGSERLAKTKATGDRMKEGIKINQGLLYLGNVISALGSGQKTVSYRESKLTRLLQGSLGGNSVTLMIACVSPADYNLDETLNTLRYADRAKRIKNKPVVNKDPISAEISRLNDVILRLRNQLAAVGRSGDALPDSSTLNGTMMLGATGGAANAFNAALMEKLKVDNVRLETDMATLQVQLHNLDTMRDGCVESVDRLNAEVLKLEEKTKSPEVNEQSEELAVAWAGIKDTLKTLKDLLAIESDETVWHDGQDSGASANETFLITQEFRVTMKNVSETLTLKAHLEKKLKANIVPEEESRAKIDGLKEKIELLEQERNELAKSKIKHKSDVSAKLAEERRRKIAQLEKDIETMRKQIAKHEKLIVLHKNTQKSLSLLQVEIKDLKQQKVTLVKNLRKDQDKLRQLQMKSDKEMNVMKEKEKKRFHEMKKLEAQHERQKLYLQRRVEEANIKARRAENLLSKQRRTKRTSLLKEPAQIEKRLNQELEIILFVSEVKASLTVLMEARTELTNQLQELQKNSPQETAGIALLEAEIEDRTHTINDLQQKIQAYDMSAKVQTMTQEVQQDEALKIMFDQVSDMQEEHYGEKLKWEATENKLKGRIEELEKGEEQHGRELLRTQKEKQDNMALLLDGFLDNDADDDEDDDAMDDEEGAAALPIKTGSKNKWRLLVKNALEEAQSWRERVEALEAELAAATKLGSGRAKGKANARVMQQLAVDAMDSDTDVDLDDSNVDPSWKLSDESVGARKKNRSLNSDASVANETVSLGCNCKTDCSRKTCGCQKRGALCGSKCGCKTCLNREDEGSTTTARKSDTKALENDEDGEEKQDSKRMKLAPNNENTDMNNTFKYPYLEKKPVFYS